MCNKMNTTRKNSQGIIRISPVLIKDFIDLTADPALIDLGKLREYLLLPERYIVEEVRHSDFSALNGYVELIVSSPDIPEVAKGKTLPSVNPHYLSEEHREDHNKRIVSLSDIKINGVSAIKEGDNQRKSTVEIKEIIDNSGVTI